MKKKKSNFATKINWHYLTSSNVLSVAKTAQQVFTESQTQVFLKNRDLKNPSLDFTCSIKAQSIYFPVVCIILCFLFCYCIYQRCVALRPVYVARPFADQLCKQAVPLRVPAH